MKKSFKLLLLLSLIILTSRSIVLAQITSYSGGNGTSGNPYQITTLADLQTLSSTTADWVAGKYFVQTTNIDASASNSGSGFSPIGNATNKFSGSYDGQNFSITALFINRSVTNNIGLFGYTNSATLKNIKLTGSSITGYDNVGVLVGFSSNSIITNCQSGGTVTGHFQVGGLIGEANGASSVITNSFSTVTVSGTNDVGGFVGENQNSSSISSCYSTGNATGGNTVGGFSAWNGSNATITNCYCIANAVSGSAYTGGFVGYSFGNITYCYTIAALTGSSKSGFLNGDTDATASFWNVETDGIDGNISGAANEGAIGKTTAEMKTQSTFSAANWNFSTIWAIDANINNGYPYLLMDAPPSPLITWDGSESTDWNTAANWDGNTIPSVPADVIIVNVANQPVINSAMGGASCNNLTVNSGASLTVQSGGSLITNGAITNNGTINIQRTITKNRWHLISAPVSGATALTFKDDYLQSWSEANATWTDIIATGTALNPVQGYGLWTMYETDHTYTFTGTPNTGNQSKSVTAQGTGGVYNRANLLGNPYPSAIDWEGLRATYGAVYYWNGSAYVSWNNGGDGSRYIAPMQGFFIVPVSAGTFSLTNANRTHTMGSYYKSAEETKDNLLVLETVSKGISDKLFVNFNDQATEDFDLQHDAYKFASGTAGLSELYSYAGDNKLSIDVRPACEVLQLGFANDQSGTYGIGINQLHGITKATLEDTKTNTFTDLLEGAYSFSFEAGENDQRFKLHFSALAVDDEKEQQASIYSYRKTAYINLNTLKQADIYIYNMAGQLITSRESATGLISINMETGGVYIVKVISNNDIQTKKIFINQ